MYYCPFRKDAGEEGFSAAHRCDLVNTFVSVLPVSGVALTYVEGCQFEKECKSHLAVGARAQAQRVKPPQEIYVSNCVLQVRRISVVILIRTDTTLDHSQEAEKVCLGSERMQ